MRVQLLLLNCRWYKLIALICLSISLCAQKKIEVQDSKAIPLAGVYVSYKNEISVTDSLGQVIIPGSPVDSMQLHFEYLGFTDLNLSWGQIQASEFVVRLKQDNRLLEEIVIIGRTESDRSEIVNKIKTIDSKQIYSSAAQNSADVLEISGGAYIQRSQMGGGSPVLRGFEANKLLLVVDGVRMNNAIYRNGHLQNAITVDASALDEMQVIFGAGSLIYGSDALGGVIHFKTKTPRFNFNKQFENLQTGNAWVRYNSANHEKRIHLNYMLGYDNWSVFTSVSAVDFDDLRTGSRRRPQYPDFGKRPEYVFTNENGEDQILENENPDIQLGTAYSQLDLLQKWRFRWNSRLESSLNIQYSTSSNVPRYDALQEKSNGIFRYAEWEYGPQKRLLVSKHLKIQAANPLFNKLIAIASFQNIDEDRITRFFNSSSREFQEEDVSLWGLTLDAEKSLNESHHLLYGIDVHHNVVESNAYRLPEAFSMPTQRSFDILTRYPDAGSQLTSTGIYAQHRWQNRDSSLVWINGMRFTYQTASLNYEDRSVLEWPEYFYDGIRSSEQAVTGISGISLRLEKFDIKASSGTAFRAPNVDDLAKVRVNNFEITIPNTELSSEYIWNNELNINYRHEGLRASGSVYFTFLNDAVVRDFASLPDGSDYFIANGDSLRVTTNVNAEEAIIKGISLNLEYRFSDHWLWNSEFNIQSGKITGGENRNQPLGHIPPGFGFARLQYSNPTWTVSANCRYNTWKHIEDFGGSVDNPELATRDGSPSYLVLSLNSEFSLSGKWRLNFGINNILDRHYRNFASGISGAGRHIHVALNYSWNNQENWK